MVIDQLGFINNLFYPTGSEVASSQTQVVNIQKPQKKEVIQRYSLSSATRTALLVPLAAWYFLWQFSPLIPLDLRPNIHVDKLSYFDEFLFSTLPHREITFLHSDHLDLVMAIPYTLHVAWPIIFALWALRKSTKLLLPFANCFGLLSFMAVVTELMFPCAPPWYFEKYGLAPATYDLPGDPGGLSRVDKLLGLTFYDNTFSKSPLVFGAFPSLHVAWPVLLAFFMWYNVCSKWTHKLPVIGYVAWVCLSVVYLHHHYVVDVLGGILYSWIAYQLVGPHLSKHADTTLPAQVPEKQPLKTSQTITPATLTALLDCGNASQ